MELLYTPGVKINWTKAEREGGFEKIGLFFLSMESLPTNLHVV
jgi:hypothetical protein